MSIDSASRRIVILFSTSNPMPDQTDLFGQAIAPKHATRARPDDRPPAPAEPPLVPPATLSAARRGLLHLGTSSWSFPGWAGLVYDAPASESVLSRHGLAAYARHPLLNAVGIDRGFYAPLEAAQYAAYAAQVPESFRFLVKAPGLVTDASMRDAGGARRAPNPNHLDVALAVDRFIDPCRQGLGPRLGVLVFQFSPLPREWLGDAAAWIARLGAFLRALPAGPLYAVEVRDGALVTPRLVHTLREAGALYCIGLHDRMPPVERQLRAVDAWEGGQPAPLVARWSLHRGVGYEQARRRYAPFTRLVDEDPDTRGPLARRAAAALDAGQPVFVTANNKAEGSAPLTLARLAEAIALA